MWGVVPEDFDEGLVVVGGGEPELVALMERRGVGAGVLCRVEGGFGAGEVPRAVVEVGGAGVSRDELEPVAVAVEGPAVAAAGLESGITDGMSNSGGRV